LTSRRLRIATVVGARPQFVKAAVISRRLRDAQFRNVDETLIHTGQHYDDNMSGSFFRELAIPEPHLNLGVGSGPHGAQTGAIMAGLERLLPELRPDLILVYGDTNSTLAAALVAAKAAIPLAHVEAGLRSRRPGMPEEINRVVTDRLSQQLFCPTDAARRNLEREGCEGIVHVVGDVMYDSFLHYRRISASPDILQHWKLAPHRYLFATVHRAENTDDPHRLGAIMAGLTAIAKQVPIVVSLHPRTRKAIDQINLPDLKDLTILDPQPYLTTLTLVSHAITVATDSGGLQKEAYFSAVPCVTLREETEWIETLGDDWNRLACPGRDDIGAIVQAAMDMPREPAPRAIFGDGDAAGRILETLAALR
jgi:UDP-GlcNAc3NAcA epimerase